MCFVDGIPKDDYILLISYGGICWHTFPETNISTLSDVSQKMLIGQTGDYFHNLTVKYSESILNVLNHLNVSPHWGEGSAFLDG